MKKLSVVLGVSLLHASTAFGALTASEQDVVRTFVKKGVLDTAPRVRALVARPDLAPDEISGPLRAGFAEAPFDRAHVRFTESLLFGPGSAASRSSLVPAVVEGLLARVSSKMADVPIDAGARVGPHERDAVNEILEIHAFIDQKIANAGTPPPEGHDGSTAIRDDAYRAALALYRTHLTAHSRWMTAPGNISPDLVRVRVQAAVTFVDLSRGIASLHELVEPLALTGTRRVLFERTGIFFDAPGGPSEDRLSELLLLETVPHVTEQLSAFLVSKVSPAGLVARRKIFRSGAAVTQPRTTVAHLWPEEVTPSFPDAVLAGAANAVAELATTRALSIVPSLGALARGAAERASRAGDKGYLAASIVHAGLPGAAGRPTPSPSADAMVAGAAQLLVLDAPRVLDLAAIRAGEGRPEPLEQLALALSVLAPEGETAHLGRTNDDGGVASVDATAVERTDGVVSAFTLLGKRYKVFQNKDAVFDFTVDGAAPKLTALPSYQERTSSGDAWTASGVDYTRLFGAPRAAGLDDGRLVVDGGPGGFDSIATGADQSDVKVTASVYPVGTGGALLLRATSGDTSYAGIALVFDPDTSRARILLADGHAKATELAAPVALPSPPEHGYDVLFQVAGTKVTAKIGGVALTGTVPDDMAPGKVGVAARGQGRLDVRKLVVGKVTVASVTPQKKKGAK